MVSWEEVFTVGVEELELELTWEAEEVFEDEFPDPPDDGLEPELDEPELAPAVDAFLTSFLILLIESPAPA